MILPVNGYQIDKNLNCTLPIISDGVNISAHMLPQRVHDKYISSIGEILNKLKSYSPLLKGPIDNWGIDEIKINLKNDEMFIKNANNSYRDYVNYLKRYKTYYGCNETLIYGNADTGELIEVREGGYGFVYSGNIPKQDNMIVIHTHPDIFYGIAGLYDPVFSYGDISGFATDYKSGVRYEGVISSRAIAITNINSAENIDKNRRYSEYNLLDDFFGRFTQKDDFEKINMYLKTTEWL